MYHLNGGHLLGQIAAHARAVNAIHIAQASGLVCIFLLLGCVTPIFFKQFSNSSDLSIMSYLTLTSTNMLHALRNVRSLQFNT